MKKFVIAASLVITSLTASAEFIDGNTLLSRLTSSDASDVAFGLGYVAGVFDQASGSRVCAPGNVTIRQVADITIAVLRKVPSLRDKSADQFVIAGVSELWPCAKTKKQDT